MDQRQPTLWPLSTFVSPLVHFRTQCSPSWCSNTQPFLQLGQNTGNRVACFYCPTSPKINTKFLILNFIAIGHGPVDIGPRLARARGPPRACVGSSAGPRARGSSAGRRSSRQHFIVYIFSHSVWHLCLANLFHFFLPIQHIFSNILWHKLTLSDPRVLSGIFFGILSGICVYLA